MLSVTMTTTVSRDLVRGALYNDRVFYPCGIKPVGRDSFAPRVAIKNDATYGVLRKQFRPVNLDVSC